MYIYIYIYIYTYIYTYIYIYIFRCLKLRDPMCLMTAYKSYILPILEYNSTVWSTHYIKDIYSIYSIQRHFTWRLYKRCRLPYMSYNDRITML